jgi:hypothetical protein
MRGFWIEGLGFSVYVRGVNNSPVNVLSVTLTPNE